jgi:hypothetical protein
MPQKLLTAAVSDADAAWPAQESVEALESEDDSIPATL